MKAGFAPIVLTSTPNFPPRFYYAVRVIRAHLRDAARRWVEGVDSEPVLDEPRPGVAEVLPVLPRERR